MWDIFSTGRRLCFRVQVFFTEVIWGCTTDTRCKGTWTELWVQWLVSHNFLYCTPILQQRYLKNKWKNKHQYTKRERRKTYSDIGGTHKWSWKRLRALSVGNSKNRSKVGIVEKAVTFLCNWTVKWLHLLSEVHLQGTVTDKGEDNFAP